MTRLSLFCLFTLFASLDLHADQPQLNDFAYGRVLETTDDGALWRIDLPDELYRSVTRGTLDDVSVFNKNGEIVPHAIRQPEQKEEAAPEPETLPFFPLYTREKDEPGSRSLHIVTDESGKIIDASAVTVPASEEERVTGYLIDRSALDTAPEKLILHWKPADPGFAAAVSVDVSDDLGAWTRVVRSAALADLKTSNSRLLHREITIPLTKYRYLRINWPEALKQVSLKKVEAAFPSPGLQSNRQWIISQGIKDKKAEHIYEFDTGGVWPVDQIRLNSVIANTVLSGELFSRAAPDIDQWRWRYSGLFYDLTHDGTRLQSDPVSLGYSTDRHWKLKTAENAPLPIGLSPQLMLGWTPHQLTFVAQGEGPYILAYGNAAAKPLARPMDSLLDQIQNDPNNTELVRDAVIGKKLLLGGDAMLEPAAHPLPWKKWLLWLVLIAGVGLLAWMANSLYRQMNGAES